MKSHHVLILAAVLFIGAGLYAAYSTPVGGSGVVAFLVPLFAAAVSIYFATSIRRGDFLRRSRSATLALLGIAAAMGVIGAIIAVSMHSATPVPQQPTGESAVTFEPTGGSRATVTLSRSSPSGADRTNLIFAASFSAGVALLAALTLAFLRASAADEPDEPSPSPAA